MLITYVTYNVPGIFTSNPHLVYKMNSLFKVVPRHFWQGTDNNQTECSLELEGGGGCSLLLQAIMCHWNVYSSYGHQSKHTYGFLNGASESQFNRGTLAQKGVGTLKMLRVEFNYSFETDGQNTVSFCLRSYLTLLSLYQMKYAVNGSHYL